MIKSTQTAISIWVFQYRISYLFLSSFLKSDGSVEAESVKFILGLSLSFTATVLEQWLETSACFPQQLKTPTIKGITEPDLEVSTTYCAYCT